MSSLSYLVEKNKKRIVFINESLKTLNMTRFEFADNKELQVKLNNEFEKIYQK